MSLRRMACSPTTATTRSATMASASGATARATATTANDLKERPSFTRRFLTHFFDPIDQPGRSRKNKGAEQMLVLDELESRGFSVDLDLAARVVEPQGVRAFVAGASPEVFGRERAFAGMLPGALALAELEAAHRLDGVTKGMRVDTQTQSHPIFDQIGHVGQAGAEIALGRRADAHERPSLAEKPRLARRDVGGMHGHELLAE